jgi:tetratricopeptide (TPR) repeat protein
LDKAHVGATFQLGLAAKATKSLDQALTWFEKTVALAPAHWEAQLEIGTIQVDRKGWVPAEAALRAAIRLKADVPQAHYLLGRVLMAEDDLLGAEQSFLAVLNLAPSFKDTSKRLGQGYLRRRAYSSALPQLKLAAAQDPRDEEVSFALAQVAIAQRDTDAAKGYLKTLLQLNPKHVQGMLAVAKLMLDGNPTNETLKEARSRLQFAMLSDPNVKEAHFLLASIEGRLGSYEAAAAAFERFLRLDTGYQYPPGTAKDAYAQPKYQVFQPLTAGLREAEVSKPGSAAALNNLGVFAARKGRLDEARRQFALAVAAVPSAVEPSCNLGLLDILAGNYAEAAVALDRALVLGGPHPAVLVNRAVARMELGQSEEAMKDLELARSLDDRSEAAIHNLGIVLARQGGDLPRARALLVKATALNPSLAKAWLALAWLDFLENKPASALALAERAMAAEPNAAAYFVRGRILGSMNKVADAVADTRKAIELAPHLTEAHSFLAQLLLSQRPVDVAAVREALHRAIVLNPADKTSAVALEEAYAREGLTAKEKAEYKLVHGFAAEEADIAQKTKATLAVLPFVPLDEATDGALGPAIGRAMQLMLGRLSGLAIKDAVGVKDADDAATGRRLGVQATLGGTVRVEGDKVILTGRIVESADGSVRQTAELQGRVSDLFGLMKEEALTLAYGFVRISVAEEERLLASIETAEPTLLAIGAAREKLAEGDLEQARLSYVKAREIDPVYVAALADAAKLSSDFEQAVAKAEADRLAKEKANAWARAEAQAAAFDARFMYSGLALATAGAVALGVGAYYGMDSKSVKKSVTDATPLTTALKNEHRANNEANRATALFIGGGTAVAAGGALMAIGLIRAEDPKLYLQVGPTGASAAVELHF